MKLASLLNRKADPEIPARGVIHRTRGAPHGPITRVFGPRDLGEALKPFVLLDYFDLTPQADPPRFPIHPHSGIATLTLVLSGNVAYEDTTGKRGVVHAGSVEWMRAGAGVWHSAEMVDRERLHGFQLWIALPRELEDASPESQYVMARDVPWDGPARVVLGRNERTRSSIRAPESLSYLDVRLKNGERWRHDPPAGHEVAWVFVYEGELHQPDTITAGELAVFEESTAPLEFVAAASGAKFLLGTAVKHPDDLVLGYYSVHTTEERLKRGAAEIRRVGERLRTAGKIDDAYLSVALERIHVGNW
jgi:redox-sensitive bicupin YhaK (pirin superfamily)